MSPGRIGSFFFSEKYGIPVLSMSNGVVHGSSSSSSNSSFSSCIEEGDSVSSPLRSFVGLSLLLLGVVSWVRVTLLLTVYFPDF